MSDNNVNENVNVVSTSNYNHINNDKYARAKKVEEIADQLVAKYRNPDSRDFYCKVAWRLSEARIWQHYESTMKVKKGSPAKLFTWLCKRDGV